MASVSAAASPAAWGPAWAPRAAGVRPPSLPPAFWAPLLLAGLTGDPGEGVWAPSLSPPTTRFLFPQPLGAPGEPVSQRSFLCVSHKCSCKVPCFSLEGNGGKAGLTAAELAPISKTKQGLCLVQRLPQPPGQWPFPGEGRLSISFRGGVHWEQQEQKQQERKAQHGCPLSTKHWWARSPLSHVGSIGRVEKADTASIPQL